MKLLLRILSVCAVLVASVPAQAVVDEASIIKGFAEWQASRIEKITLDIGLSQIVVNRHVKAFFPTTADTVAYELDSNGSALARVVKEAIDKDLDRMKYISGSCLPTLLNSSLVKLKDQVDENGELVNGYDEAVLQSVKADLKRIYQGFQGLVSGRDNEIEALKGKPETGGKIESSLDFDDLVCVGIDYRNQWNPVKVDEYSVKKYLKGMQNWARSGAVIEDDGFNKFIVNNRLGKMVDYLVKIYVIAKSERSTVNNYILAKKLDQNAASLNEMYRSSAEEIGYVVQVQELMKIIDVYIGFGETDYPGFRKLKRTSLFLAEMADASNAGSSDVAAVLTRYVDEQNAYKSKREPTGYWNRFERFVPNDSGEGGKWESYSGTCRNWWILTCSDSLFLSSFWGVAYSHDSGDDPISESQRGWRAFGPVGLEWKWFTYNGRAISLNYAPVDIGAYVENELRDTEYSASFSDINSPSAFLSLSMKRYPIAYLLGHQWNLKSDRGEENSVFFAITFDLPIFTLY